MTESKIIRDVLLNERKATVQQAKEVISGLNGFVMQDKHSGKDLKRYNELSVQAIELIFKLQLIDKELNTLD